MKRIFKKYKFVLAVHDIFYMIFFFVLSLIPSRRKLIVFECFGGRKYDDSPRYIYEKMIKDKSFDNFDFVWIFTNPDKFTIEKGVKVKKRSLKAYFYIIKAKCLVANAGGMFVTCHFFKWNLMNKKQFYLNTWHGTPMKKIGGDQLKFLEGARDDFEKNSQVKLKRYGNISVVCAQAKYDAQIFSRIFEVPYEKVLIEGLPRNDMLANVSDSDKMAMKNKLGLPDGKKVILYCPTWRDDEIDVNANYSLKPPIDFNLWQSTLGNDYIILLRAHHNIKNMFLSEKNDGFVRDFSSYECLNDLFIASDIMISDYSSVYFDYSILGRPMLCFAYDYEKYMQGRGMYFDMKKELPCEAASNEKDLLEQIVSLDYDTASQRAVEFRSKFVEAYGNATDACVKVIRDSIKERDSHI